MSEDVLKMSEDAVALFPLLALACQLANIPAGQAPCLDGVREELFTLTPAQPAEPWHAVTIAAA